MRKSYKMKRNKHYAYTNKTEKKSAFRRWWWTIPVAIALVIAVIVIVNSVKTTSDGKTVSSVSISSLPDKTVFYVGEQPSYKGFAVTTTLNNGTTFTEGPEACTFSGFDSRFAVKNQEIVVTYGEYVFTYNIEIKELPRPLIPLEEISLKVMPKTEYKVGETMNISDGIILLQYEDGSSREIRLKYSHIYDFSTAEAGVFTVSVIVEENGYLATCTYEITVTE